MRPHLTNCRRAVCRQAVALLAIGITASPALAEQLSVKDCTGVPRAVADVEENSLTAIEVKIASSSEASLEGISLTLTADANRAEATVKNARAVFRKVPAGTWNLCPSDTSITVSEVNILGSHEAGGLSKASILGGAGVAITSIGAAALLSGGSSSGSDSDSPTGPALSGGQPTGDNVIELEPEAKPEATGNEGSDGIGGGASRKPPCAAADGCLTDVEPDPISPFR